MEQIIFFTGTFSIIAGAISFVVFFKRWQEKQSALLDVSAIPQYRRPKLKLYEIGTLIDGKLHKEDIVAVAAEHHLYPQDSLDKVERFIIKHLDTPSELKRFRSNFKSKKERKRQDKFIETANKMVYKKLMKDGFYRYNPFWIRSTGAVVLFVLFRINIGDEDNLDPDFMAVLFSIFLPFYTLSLIAISLSYRFHENLEKVIPVMQEIKGYKMFFETTEKHRTVKDLIFYEKQMPMMIALGVFRNQWDELLKHIEKRWKQGK